MFYDKLSRAWTLRDSMVCVGLDPDPQRIPACIASDTPYLDFCRAIVDATAPYACAFKAQAAHFAAFGREHELAELFSHIKLNHPGHIAILDAKRGDIGSTAQFYAREAYERYNADAVTLNPYLGEESIRPFLEYEDRGVIVLCRTSNADSDWLQGVRDVQQQRPLYQRVAERVASWNDRKQCMLVTGATYPKELADIRSLIGDMPLLVPGIGAQGGDLEAVVKQGADSTGQGLLISSSRNIIYASEGDDFADAAAKATRLLQHQIKQL